jgi:hypothetical protein
MQYRIGIIILAVIVRRPATLPTPCCLRPWLREISIARSRVSDFVSNPRTPRNAVRTKINIYECRMEFSTEQVPSGPHTRLHHMYIPFSVVRVRRTKRNIFV